MKPSGGTDFERAFRPGERFTTSDNETMIARQQSIGTVTLPSGQLMACDPSYLISHKNLVPFVRTVAPGTYPVTLALVDYLVDQSVTPGDITCARIDFSSETPTAWELAVLPDQDPRTLPLGSLFGFGVDGGMACFLDGAARQQITEQRTWDSTLRQLEFPWTHILLDPTSGANLVAFKAGYGDGYYPSYWGLDEEGQITCFIIDFLILVKDVEDEAQFTLWEWKETELTHMDFERIRLTVRCIPQDLTGHELLFRMTGNAPKITIRDREREYHSNRLPLRQYGRDVFEYRFTFEEPLSDAATITIRYFLGVTAL
ncbi:MAG: DUF4241 domain-containing protein [Chloroflexota bacterium]